MFNSSRMISRSICAFLVVFFSPDIVPRTRGAQPERPIFTCRAPGGMECAYTINDTHGSVNMVLWSGESRAFDEKLIGASYCVAWGRPRVALPSWPQCLGVPNGPGHAHDVVRPGNSNG